MTAFMWVQTDTSISFNFNHYPNLVSETHITHHFIVDPPFGYVPYMLGPFHQRRVSTVVRKATSDCRWSIGITDSAIMKNPVARRERFGARVFIFPTEPRSYFRFPNHMIVIYKNMLPVVCAECHGQNLILKIHLHHGQKSP
jgi:hypothetical protein